MRRQSITEISHLYLKHIVENDHVLIDATMGHGNDTIFLSSICSKVYAFDIQEDAVKSTRDKITKLNIDNVDIIKDSHENYLNYVSNYNGVIFNLGYLPKGDKNVTTKSDVTIRTLTSMLNHLNVQGYIVCVVYPGHSEGYTEHQAIWNLLSTLDPKQYKIIRTDLPLQDNMPPYILWITKTIKPSKI